MQNPITMTFERQKFLIFKVQDGRRIWTLRTQIGWGLVYYYFYLKIAYIPLLLV